MGSLDTQLFLHFAGQDGVESESDSDSFVCDRARLQRVSESAGDWARALQEALKAECLMLPAQRVSVMTDCSGLESPILGLQSVGVSIEHVSACDINPDVRAWIQKHYSPAQIHTDMLTRDTSSLPRNVDLYCCGFPCTPFSMRRTNSTKLFEEAAARVFFKTIETLIHVKPKVFVLENVRGILRPACKDAMLTHLEPLAQQHSLVWIMPNESDPKRFGYPIERPRVYIVGIRRDRHCTKTAHQLDQTIHRCLETVALKVRC